MKPIFRLILVAALAMPFADATSQIKLRGKYAQEYNKAYHAALGTDYSSAIPIFRKLYAQYPNNIDIAFNLGVSYLNASGNPDSTMYFLNRALELDTDTAYTPERIELFMALARAHQLKYDYDGANALYDLVEPHADSEVRASIAREREICRTAVNLMQHPVVHGITPLTSLNSKYNDYRPLISADASKLIFTSRRPTGADQRPYFADGQFEERIYESTFDGEQWSKPKRISGLYEGDGQETATCLSVASNEIYMQRAGDIYFSQLDSVSEWKPAVRLPEPINSDYDDVSPYVNADNTELYFASNRPGGYGGYDIYRSYRLPNGQWAQPRNLGSAVNTAADELSPVIHPSGRLLYFCSEGHNTMGGFDIFYSNQETDSTYQTVSNIGYPINTPDDDLYFMPTALQNVGYYASFEWKGESNSSFNLYKVDYEDQELATLVVMKGTVRAANLQDVRLTVYTADGEVYGRYRVNEYTGQFVLILNAGFKYDIICKSRNAKKTLHLEALSSDAYSKSSNVVMLDDIVLDEVAQAEPAVTDYIVPTISRGANGLLLPPSSVEMPYTVQVMSLRKRLSPNANIGLDRSNLFEYEYKDGWFVYSYGSFETKSEADKVRRDIVSETYMRDSFVRNVHQYSKYIKTTTDK